MNVDTLRHEDYDLIGESDRILLEAADPVAFPAGKCMLRIYFVCHFRFTLRRFCLFNYI